MINYNYLTFILKNQNYDECIRMKHIDTLSQINPFVILEENAFEQTQLLLKGQ